MKITIKIPKIFEIDYNKDKFIEFFERVMADIDCKGVCGVYEKEIAHMFKYAFFDSEVINDKAEKTIAKHDKQIRAEAIDDCLQKIKEYVETNGTLPNHYNSDLIAEQLKVGGENEN